MCRGDRGAMRSKTTFFVADDCHPQTIAVVQTRAQSLGIECVVGRSASRQTSVAGQTLFGVLLQYPTTDGRIVDYADVVETAHDAGALVVVAADLLALTLLTPPGEFGADIAVGSTQRFGVPMGFGGPHAAFIATKPEYARKMPGRIIGVSQGRPRQPGAAPGAPDPRAAHPPREGDEQHLHRPGAAGGHGQHVRRLPRPARAAAHRRARPRADAARSPTGLERLGHIVGGEPFFDTLRVTPNGLPAESVIAAARSRAAQPPRLRRRLRRHQPRRDRHAATTSKPSSNASPAARRSASTSTSSPRRELRASANLKSQIRSSSRTRSSTRYHSETRDAPLHPQARSRATCRSRTSMIPLGSCTMKLNATSEMIPVTWPEFGSIHPFAPGRPDARATSSSSSDLEKLARRDHRLRRRLAAAQRRLAGRVRRPARDPRLPREPRRQRTATSA